MSRWRSWPVAVVASAALVFALASAGTASAEFINLDIGHYHGAPENGAPITTYGAASGQDGAWQMVSNGTSVESNVVDITGAATDVSILLSFGALSGNISLPYSDPLMGDNFFSASPLGWSVVFAGLDDGVYDIYYYAPAHPLVSTGVITINGTTVASLPGDDVSEDFVQGVNWDVLHGVPVTGGSLTLTATSVDAYSGLAGIQITPEPSTALLFGAGLVAMSMTRRRGPWAAALEYR